MYEHSVPTKRQLQLCLAALVATSANAIMRRVSTHDGATSNYSSAVAFMTVLTNDPKPGKLARLDGAGVLAESIRKHMGHLNPDIIAIVPATVTTSRPILAKYGYKVIEKPLPDLSLIRNPAFAKEVETDGCCGAGEMLKLEAYRLTQYDRVIVMDTDTLVHASFEELFSRPEMTLYTAPYKETEKEYLQGSFLVVKPSIPWYDEIMEVWHAGNFSGEGWEKSGIGYSYGGRTIQGLLPYFLNILHPAESAEVDHCVYNNNGDERGGYCTNRSPNEAKMNHFTVCQKPWYCAPYKSSDGPCVFFTDEWWKTRDSLAARLGEKEEGHACHHYADGMSSNFTPILTEELPVTEGW